MQDGWGAIFQPQRIELLAGDGDHAVKVISLNISFPLPLGYKLIYNTNSNKIFFFFKKGNMCAYFDPALAHFYMKIKFAPDTLEFCWAICGACYIPI